MLGRLSWRPSNCQTQGSLLTPQDKAPPKALLRRLMPGLALLALPVPRLPLRRWRHEERARASTHS